MIRNYKSMNNLYYCSKIVSDHLTKKCGIPMLSYDSEENLYIFSNTKSLKEELKRLPLWLKFYQFLLSVFSKEIRVETYKKLE